MGNDPSPIAATRPSWMGLARKAKRLDVVSLHLASLHIHARGDSDRSEADCVCEGGQACLPRPSLVAHRIECVVLLPRVPVRWFSNGLGASAIMCAEWY
jgi:hypothetical protein